MRRLVIVSATYVDTVLTVPYYPSEDEKLRATSLAKRRGGNGANTAEVFQRLLEAVPVSDVQQVLLLTVLPARESAASIMITSSLPGVDCTRCIHRSGSTEPASSYIVRSRQTGSRTSVSHSSLAGMTAAEFAAVADALGDEACWYHFEGREPDVLQDCMAHLRRRHPAARISLELENPSRVGLLALLPFADVLFYSRSWAQAHGHASAEEFLRRTRDVSLPGSSALLFCTWGAGGADAWRCGDDDGHVHVDGVEVDPASIVDTVGAGDTFIAAVLFGLLRAGRQRGLASILAFANQLAGRKVQGEGFSHFDLSGVDD